MPVLGQRQGLVRKDADAIYMALVLLGIYGQAMLNVLAGEQLIEGQITRLVRIVLEGIGDRSKSSPRLRF